MASQSATEDIAINSLSYENAAGQRWHGLLVAVELLDTQDREVLFRITKVASSK